MDLAGFQRALSQVEQAVSPPAVRKQVRALGADLAPLWDEQLRADLGGDQSLSGWRKPSKRKPNAKRVVIRGRFHQPLDYHSVAIQPTPLGPAAAWVNGRQAGRTIPRGRGKRRTVVIGGQVRTFTRENPLRVGASVGHPDTARKVKAAISAGATQQVAESLRDTALRAFRQQG